VRWTQPRPRQSFCPLQALSALLQADFPLQELPPQQAISPSFWLGPQATTDAWSPYPAAAAAKAPATPRAMRAPRARSGRSPGASH
jgi:hypothetical protein